MKRQSPLTPHRVRRKLREVPLHDDEIPVDEAAVRSLLRSQRPGWAELPLARAGAGTENTMFRLGDDLLVRLPRTLAKAAPLRKEQEWLPRLAPLLPLTIPRPVFAGAPGPDFPAPWSVYHWIEGSEAADGTVTDWAAFGASLAGFVECLHGIDLMGATRDGPLSWYRGGSLRDCDHWVRDYLRECRPLVGDELNVDALNQMWQAATDLPDPAGPHVWLHGDLKPTNLLVRAGQLHAVIDFGALSIGFPDAEHATVWDLPAEAREAYWNALALDDATWTRARGWAVAVAVAGIPYYWTTYPSFVTECRSRLASILTSG
jgi:aminoglycoside phosphotransferase (APT) family kinase protein